MVPPFHWWRTVLFLIPAITLYTIVLGTLSIGSSLFDKSGQFAHWCARTWARLILVTTRVRIEVTGLDRLDLHRTYVFVSNHQSHYDTAILFATLPFQLRIIAKQSLGSVPFLGWHLRRTGHILVDRHRPDRRAILGWAKRLTAGGLSLIVYPEGTRSADGRVAKFKTGSFHIALGAELPVVPISIVGSRHVMLRGRLAAYPGRVSVVVHEPIETRGLDESDVREFADRAQLIIAPDAERDLDTAPPDVDAVHARA